MVHSGDDRGISAAGSGRAGIRRTASIYPIQKWRFRRMLLIYQGVFNPVDALGLFLDQNQSVSLVGKRMALLGHFHSITDAMHVARTALIN